MNNKEIVKNYKMYQYYQDPFWNNSESSLPGERGILEPSDPNWKKIMTGEDIEQQILQNDANINNGGLIQTKNT